MDTKTVTVRFTVPVGLDLADWLRDMGEEFYYANKSNEELSEMLDYVSWEIEGDN